LKHLFTTHHSTSSSEAWIASIKVQHCIKV
jgi:hypothetical protein